METISTQRMKVNIDPTIKKLEAVARRMLDVAASAAGLLALSPVFLVIAFFIRRDSPGPIFYLGPRSGRDGKPFGILKFRTMFERQESYEGPRVTAAGDSRVTPFGRWLRETKVNELPQLWNVLKGDMSLVGPRPEDPEIVKTWPESLRNDLLSVRPGITSPATVMFRDEEERLLTSNVLDNYLKDILPDKLRLDRNYIRNRNLFTDLDVIFMTLLVLLPKLRKIEVPEATLYWGPIAKFVTRNLNWFLADTLTAFLAIGVSASLWRLSAPFHIGIGNWMIIAVAVALGFSVINSSLGLTRIQWRRAPSRHAILLAFSSLCASLILILVDKVILKTISMPIPMIIITGMLSFCGFSFTRYRERVLTGLATVWLESRGSKKMAGERVILVGAGYNSQLAIWFLTHSEFASIFSIVGIVDDDPRKQGMYFDGYRVIGTSSDLPKLVEKNQVDLTLFTITNIDGVERSRILKNCQSARSRVVIFPDVMTELRSYFHPATGQKPVIPQAEYSTIGD